jgi:hypothetical protein
LPDPRQRQLLIQLIDHFCVQGPVRPARVQHGAAA